MFPAYTLFYVFISSTSSVDEIYHKRKHLYVFIVTFNLPISSTQFQPIGAIGIGGYEILTTSLTSQPLPSIDQSVFKDFAIAMGSGVFASAVWHTRFFLSAYIKRKKHPVNV